MLVNILEHQKALKRHKNQKKKTSLLTSFQTKLTFNMDLCEALLAANISLNKLSNGKFSEFQKNIQVNIYHLNLRFVRVDVDDVYNKTIKNIKTQIGKNKICVRNQDIFISV